MNLFFDIGGTKIRCATFSAAGELMSIKTAKTPGDFNSGISRIKGLADDVSNASPTSVVVGIAGSMDKDKGILYNSPNLTKWNNKNILDALEEIFPKADVQVENDTALSGMGEAYYGAGKGYNILAYITVSTGVGGVKISEGEISHNTEGFEIGRQIIDSETLSTPETYLSGREIKKERDVEPYEITDDKFWDERARYLSILIYNTNLYWSPDVFILGGSMNVGKKGPVIPIDEIRKYFNSLPKIDPNRPEILCAKLGDQTGLYGGLAYLNKSQ